MKKIVLNVQRHALNVQERIINYVLNVQLDLLNMKQVASKIVQLVLSKKKLKMKSKYLTVSLALINAQLVLMIKIVLIVKKNWFFKLDNVWKNVKMDIMLMMSYFVQYVIPLVALVQVVKSVNVVVVKKAFYLIKLLVYLDVLMVNT